MFTIKARMKMLQRIAQQAAPAPISPSTVAPPPSFVASQIFGWMSKFYNSATLNAINGLVSIINIALHYASNGQFNFQELHNDGFQVDPSGAPSVDAKNLINLAIMVYKTLLNSGNPMTTKPTPAQIQSWTKMIISSQAFLNLSQINPTGLLAQKVPGNLKDTIQNYLRYLEMYNPAQQR